MSDNEGLHICSQRDNILELKRQVLQLITNDAVKNNEIDNLKGDIITMTENINKLAEKLDRTFDKLDSNINKIVWFGLSTSVVMIISIIVNVVK